MPFFFYQMLNTFKLTTSSEYAALYCAPYSVALSVPQLWSEDCLPHSSRPASRPYSECQGSLLQPLHCCTFHCENWAWHRVYRDWSWSLTRNTWSWSRALIVSWCTACWRKNWIEKLRNYHRHQQQIQNLRKCFNICILPGCRKSCTRMFRSQGRPST